MKTASTLLLSFLAFFPLRGLAQCSVNAGNDDTVYYGYPPMACATLTAMASGTAPFSYPWSNGDSTQSITVCDTTTTTYWVTITDSSGCTASDTVTVFVINVSCGANNNKVLVCHVPPGNPANAHTICISPNAVPAHLAHGDYLGACSPPPFCSVSLGPDLTACPGDSVVLDAGSGWVSYLWSDSSTSQTLVVTTTGAYWVVVTDAANCTASDTIVVTFNTSPPVDLGPDQTLCPGDSTTLDAGPGYTSYLWSDSSTAQTLTAAVPGTYWVMVMDSNQCQGSDTIEVTMGSLLVDLGPDQFVQCPDSCTTLSPAITGGTPPFTYAWSTGDSTSSVTVCDSGAVTYHVTVTDSNGCSGSDTITVEYQGNTCGPNKVFVCHVPPGNPGNAHTICISKKALKAHLKHGDELGCCDNFTGGGGPRYGITINPNPAYDRFSLHYLVEEPGEIAIGIYTIDGRHVIDVFSGYSEATGWVHDIFLTDQPQGLYVVRILTSSGQRYDEKFMWIR